MKGLKPNNKCYAKLKICAFLLIFMDYVCVDHEDVRMYVQEMQTLTYKHYIQNQNTCLSLDGGILTEPF